jgi:hypothetical protein
MLVVNAKSSQAILINYRWFNILVSERFLKHNLTEARYTYAQGLIFVTAIEKPLVIITIEAT